MSFLSIPHRDDIACQARAFGFDTIGISKASLASLHGKRLEAFIAKGHHGDMHWLAERVYERSSPHQLWPEAKSVIALGVNYGVNDSMMIAQLSSHKEQGITSLYAARKDYHDIVKKNLKQFGRWLYSHYECEIKIFIDTAPLLEKNLAQQAGLGWQGKHSNLVSRQFGSWLLLGFVMTTLELAIDDAEEDHCGQCHRCLDICPTNAFPAPYQLDARRCIAYLTIENKAQIPLEFRKAIGNHIFGCDDCLAICPWNKFAQESQLHKMELRPELLQKPLLEWLALTEEDFKILFKGTPVKRTGYHRFMRNVLVACGNAPSDSLLITALKTKIEHISPLVRGMAIWAIAQHICIKEWEELKHHYAPHEQDESVQQEWHYQINAEK